MSYLVLARKWRPETFSQVVGQKHVVTTLAAALKTDRIAHAYLFAGPRGVGKTTIARILAKALNCEKGPTDEPCMACDSCREVASGRSLDVIEIDGASNRRIEDARGIRETVQYAPLSGRMKVYIIDEAHMLTREAFNALLKTLEEPPPHVVFVLATTEPTKIPDTIVSRCQRFDFHRVGAADLEGRLSEIAKAESINIDDAAIKLLALRADGSMRDAESLFDQLIAAGMNEVGADDVAAVLGIPRTKVFCGLADAIAGEDTAEAFRTLGAALDAGFDPRDLVDGLVEHLRDLLILRAAGERGAVPERLAERRGHEGPSASLTVDQLVRLVRIGADAQAQARWSTQPSLMVELALARMTRLARTVDLEEIVRALAAAPGSPSPGGGAASAAPSHQEPRGGTAAGGQKAGAPPAEGGGAEWSIVVERVRAQKPALAAFLGDAVVAAPSQGELQVLIPNGSSFHRQQLQDRGNMTLLERAACDVYGQALKLRLAFGQPLREQAGPEGPGRRNRAGDSADPMVRKVLEMFDGEITGTRKEE
jgi:DNA polymerase-3 subunit gamma/tau